MQWTDLDHYIYQVNRNMNQSLQSLHVSVINQLFVNP